MNKKLYCIHYVKKDNIITKFFKSYILVTLYGFIIDKTVKDSCLSIELIR